MLTDATGFPLALEAFEGNKAETATVLPVINAFKKAHQLTDVTVVADAGMIPEANQVAIQAAGLSFILGTRVPFLPGVVGEWRAKHPDEAIPDQLVLTQPWPSSSSERVRGIPDRVVHYQFRHDRARRTPRGIDEQIAKAQRAVDGKAPGKTQPVHHLDRGDQDGQPGPRGQGPRVGRRYSTSWLTSNPLTAAQGPLALACSSSRVLACLWLDSHNAQTKEIFMKYVLEWRVRPGIGGQQAEADTQRAYDLYSKWQPKVTILQFVGRIDAEGGFMVCEADNPADILEGTSKLANYVQYKCHPVVDVAEWVQAGQEGIGFRSSIS